MADPTQADLRALAARVAGGVELLDVRMVQSSAEHLGFPVSGSPLSYDLDVQPTAHFDGDSQGLVVSIEFSLTMDQEAEEEGLERRQIATISFTLVALFETPEEANYGAEELESFGATTGIFCLYPYAREYVQDVTGRLGLPPLTLGVYRISAPDDIESRASNSPAQE